MLLSIIVISHNQKDQLRRCVDSILQQSIPFQYEIIISDDNSSEGTWELALEYSSIYKEISAYRCNTSDYNPINNSARSGWNRCNGYKHAKGKYIAHIDGDDFYLSETNILSKQVALLESHPECSCCMANDYDLNDGEEIGRVVIRHKEYFETGNVLSSEDYIRNYFRESHCFVYRRNPEFDPVELYGGYYVDALITSHHIQFGDIVCLDDAGYVYVHYKSSIWAKNSRGKDNIVFSQALYMPLLVPYWSNVYYTECGHLKAIMRTIWLALTGYQLRDDVLPWVRSFRLFVCHAFNRKLSIIDKTHLFVLFLSIGFSVVVNPKFVNLSKFLKKYL